MFPAFKYARAESVKDAINLLSSKDMHIHAGGTDLLGCLRDDVFQAERLLSISNIDSLKGISRTNDKGLRLGALVTLTEIAENPLILEHYTALAQAAAAAASPQLRNQGTIGGNICQKPRCWYYRGEFHCLRKGGDTCFAINGKNAYHCILGGNMCYIVHPSDPCTALVALDAVVKIAGKNGKRSVPIDEFFVSPEVDVQKETILDADEMVTEIVLPSPEKGRKSSYKKIRARRSWDFALSGIALSITLDDDKNVKNAKAVLSGVAPVPWVSKEIEQTITGEKLSESLIKKAADAAVKNASPLSENAYKIRLLKGVIESSLSEYL